MAGDAAVVSAKMAKAAEFLLIAEFALEGGSPNAATSLAVSAGINASDALLAKRAGTIPSGPDHEDATRTLRKNGYDQVASHLSRLLSVKGRAQYGVASMTPRQADDAVKRASRLIDAVNDDLSKG